MNVESFMEMDLMLKDNLAGKWRIYYPDLEAEMIAKTPHACVPYCPICKPHETHLQENKNND